MKYRLTVVVILACACVACSPIGPDYVRPTMDTPDSWKSTPGADPITWSTSNPQDAVPKSDWWTIFGDEKLNELEEQCITNNQNLKAAIAKIDQAKAQYGVQSAALLPTIQGRAAVGNTRISANRPLQNSPTNQSTIQDDWVPYISASYEFDWLGKIRRSVEAANDTLQQVTAEKENVQLILTGQVADSYFRIRQIDDELKAMTDTIGLQEKVLNLITKRHDLGASSEVDLVQQAALTEATKAQIELLRGIRNQLEDTLATLTGVPAPDFKLAAGSLPKNPPVIPVSVPSTLLERRPDIAAAERAMAAANAQIGVAKAAYFPTLALTPTYFGYESRSLPSLFSIPSTIWALGIAATQTIFDGGKTSSIVDYANATYTLATANYKQTVLAGIQDAQDALGNVQQLKLARTNEDKSLANLNRAYELSLIRYKAGLDNALTLALVQQNQMAAIRLQAQIKGSQFASTVGLIKALGGSWENVPEKIAQDPQLIQ